jgi:hypothetical protein
LTRSDVRNSISAVKGLRQQDDAFAVRGRLLCYRTSGSASHVLRKRIQANLSLVMHGIEGVSGN